MMKKIFVIAVALMMVAGMAYAEDRLSLNGQFYVRGWDKDGIDYDGDAEESYFEQRFRLGGKIAVADDVSVNFRMDIGEGVWGLDYGTGAVARPGSSGAYDRAGASKIDFDRAFITIDKEMWSLTAGQQYMGLGITQVFDVNATGFNLGLKFDPVKVSLLYSKRSEGGSKRDDTGIMDSDYWITEFDDETGTTSTQVYAAGDAYDAEDTDVYAVNVDYSADAFNAKVFYVMGHDSSATDWSPWALGFYGSAKLGMINLLGELSFLGGDTDNGATDYTGTQLYVTADANVTEMIKVGAEILYAPGTDDANEEQLTNLGDWDSFTPFSLNVGLAGFGGWVSAFPSWDAFDPFGISGGVVGGTIFADFTPMEKLRCGAKVGMFEAEEDAALPGAELLAYNIWVDYTIATNTTVGVVYLVSSPDADGQNYDDAKTAMAQLSISF